jgi:undecaprenyl-diphosphatase
LNDFLLSFLLGIIEGLTEFLPVSSTAHLRLSEAFLGVDLGSGYWKMYSIVIQLGAILCLPIYFRSRISEFISTFPQGSDRKHTIWNHPLSLTAVAFVVTAGPAFLLTKVIGKNLENVHIMAYSLIIGGVIMWVVDAIYGKPHPQNFRGGTRNYKTESMEEMSFWQAVWIGFCQIFSAVFPGTSRSMSTIVGGQLTGMSRPSALEFSFFVSIPTMLAATCYDLFKSFHHKPGATDIGTAPVNGHQWAVLILGFVVSFIVAYAVVAWFMSWVRRRGFAPFAIYRIALGIVVLVWAARITMR